jgi:choline-sulfatase
MADHTNVLLIMSDEHRRDALGVAGHPHVETPNLDRLAGEGTRFSNAYCPSPLCAPSRASFATGRYVHETGHWDNATPYDGTPESWGAYFDRRDVDVTTVGKLDFEPGVDDGFDDQRLATHRETPDVNGLYRDPVIQRSSARDRILAAGPVEGDAWYTDREDATTDTVVDFLERRANGDADDPWVLWANYIVPHFPLEVESRLYERYPPDEMDLPVDYPASDDHPILEELRYHFDGQGLDEEVLRRTRSAYYGLCTALDEYVGRVLDALDRLGMAEDTLVVYTSDHGEPLGDHECWWKCCMYESAAGVPLIARGPGIDSTVVDQPVSLLDLIPTMADAVGTERDPAWQGESLLPLLRGDSDPDPSRTVFSEYHAHGVSHGMFMLRREQYKYVYYPDNPPQLFDVAADPEELENLATDPEYADVCEEFERELRERVDPEAVDSRAKRNQRERLAKHDASVEEPHADRNHMLSRRSPIGQSESGLASRDYQPRTGGPEVLASWPLGSPPDSTELGHHEWEVTETEYVPLQNALFSPPFMTGHNYSPAYLVVCGRGCVDDGETLSIELSNETLSGKPYETEIELTNTDPRAFMTPLIEVTPDRPDYESKPWGPDYAEFRLSAKVSGGSGYLDPGTNVQLWSE